MLGVTSVFVWLLSIALFVVGAIFCCIATLRSKGLVIVAGSFGLWFLSMGMCAVAPMTSPQSPVATNTGNASAGTAGKTGGSNSQPPARRSDLDAAAAPDRTLPAAPALEASPTPEPASTPAAPPAPAPPRATPPSPPRGPALPKGKWKGGSQPATGTLAYTLDAENEITGALGKHRPRLIVRCRERKTDAYVNVGMASQPDLTNYQRYAVKLRFDDTPPSSQLWSASTDSEVLFSPSSIALAQQMAKTKRLRLEITPFGSDPQVVDFDTRGFDQMIGLIAHQCDWQR